MKKIRLKSKDYQEDYLINSKKYDPVFPGLQVHSFCHSFFTPQWQGDSTPQPYLIASMILSGKDSYTTQDGDHIIQDTNFFYINDLNYTTDNQNIHKKENTLERYFILLHTNRQLHSLLSILFPQGLPGFIPSNPARLKRCFEDIRRVLNRRGETDNNLLGAMGYRLLVEAASQTAKPTNKPESLILAQKYIENHFCQSSLNRNQIASAVGINQATLGYLFQHHLHTTVNHYVLSLRMEKTKNMLTNTDLSITEISKECGFSYGYYFSKVFKNSIGVYPKQYRLQSSDRCLRIKNAAE